ncbi:MAG: hypothetical protein OEY90_02500, partial [Candidatus Bathyarchaeota archaeon]|nr:hypothetical protein [Candidatus Bathyarchaeota archaeon]
MPKLSQTQTPAQASTQLRRVLVVYKSGKPTTTPTFQISRPPKKTLSLEAAVVVKQIHEKTTTTPSFQVSCPAPEKLRLELLP